MTTCHWGETTPSLALDGGGTNSIHLIMDFWEAQVAELQLKLELSQEHYNTTERGPDWWRMLRRIPTVSECDEKMKEIRSQIHGCLRQEMRMSMDYTRETIETMQVEVRSKVGTKWQSRAETSGWTRPVSSAYARWRSYSDWSGYSHCRHTSIRRGLWYAWDTEKDSIQTMTGTDACKMKNFF